MSYATQAHKKHHDKVDVADFFLVKTFRADYSGSRLLALWMLSHDIANRTGSYSILNFVGLGLFVLNCNLWGFLARSTGFVLSFMGIKVDPMDYFLVRHSLKPLTRTAAETAE